MKSVAIMQPYFLPYIGYFQLIDSVDVFVLYDDVHFIKKGFIHRNSILLNGKPHRFSIPLDKPSQNKLINETQLSIDDKWLDSFFKTINHAYCKAPFFEEVNNILKSLFDKTPNTISELAIKSVKVIAQTLDLNTKFETASLHGFPKVQEKAQRLVQITQYFKGDRYINPSGGQEIYSKEQFMDLNMPLYFLEHKLNEYKQFDSSFRAGLSILDVMMFNDSKTIKNNILKGYRLI